MADSYIARQRAQSEGAKRRRERSGGSSSSLKDQQSAEQQRKYDKAVAAGVDPDVAARAFNVTREGTTDLVYIQSKQGVGVTARTKEGGNTSTTQAFYDRNEGSSSLGSQYAIPTDAQGRTNTDLRLEARQNPAMVDFGPLRYAGPATPTSRTAVAVGTPNFPVDFPVYGTPTRIPIPDRVLRAFPEPKNNRFVPDFLENPARQVAQGFRDTRREPGRFTERFVSQPGFYSVGAVGGVASKISELPLIATGFGASRSVALGITSRLGATGAIAGLSVASVLAPVASSRLRIRGDERAFLTDPRFQAAFTDARIARTEGENWAVRALDRVPGFGPSAVDVITRGESSRRFRESFGERAISENLDFGQINVGVREFEARQAGGGAGLVLSQGPGELVGRFTYGGSSVIARPGVRAFVSTLPAGALEAGLVLGSEAEASRTTLKRRDLALAMAGGALTAGSASAVIVGNLERGRILRESADFVLDPTLQSNIRRQGFRATARGNVVQSALNVADPPEVFGDTIADAIMRPRTNTRVFTVLPDDFSFTNVFENAPLTGSSTTTRSSARPTTNARSAPSVADFVGVPSPVGNVPVPARTPTATRIPVASRIRSPSTLDFVGTTARNPVTIRSPVDTRPTIPVQPRSPVNTNTLVPVNPFVPVNPIPRADTFTWINAFTETRNPVTIRTPVNVPTITGFAFPPSGFLGGGGFGFGARRSKRRTKNLPSLTAAIQKGFNAEKSIKSLKGKSFSGVEIRGFL